jgi:hypothetical protein
MVLEVFPTNHSCAAGCNHCPLSRKLDKNPSSKINTEVLTTSQLIAQVAKDQKKPIDFVYAGHIDMLSEHFIQIFEHPEQVSDIRFAYDPKDTRSFHVQTQVVAEQINILNQQVSGLKLNEFAGTVYPKNKFHLTKSEKAFVVKTLKIMSTLSGVNQKKCRYVVELHANMITPDLYEKKFPMFESGNSKLFDELYPLLNLFGKPGMINKNFFLLQHMGYCYTSSLSLGYFEKRFNKSIEVKTRFLTHAEYGSEWKERDKHIHQGTRIIAENFGHDVFSPTPEGVMIMHSSLHITNPVIWIDHEEFRAALEICLAKKIPLAELGKKILESNLKFVQEHPTTLHYLKSMRMFKEKRKSLPIIQ